MYSATTYQQPFWAENSGFITGRDPLGIQNSSIALYGRLLPGMTNLTLRLRYYGFYCWLLSEYHRLYAHSQKAVLNHQYNFMRRGELIMAFLMINLDETEQSIVGNDYAKNNLGDIGSVGFYNIKKGADRLSDSKNEGLYWKYPSGAFGQYFLGSLINLDLVEVESKFFLIKERGIELAEAFKDCIDISTRQRYLNTIEKGELVVEDIVALQSFAISNIQFDSPEWHYYNKLLLNEDEPQFKNSKGQLTANRKQTIALFLEYLLDKKEDGKSFQATQFLSIEKDKSITSAQYGWYYYYLNETFHFCIETIFWAMLDYLDGRTIEIRAYMNELAEKIASEAEREYISESNITIKQLLKSICSFNIVDELQSLIALTRSSAQSEKAATSAIRLLFLTYNLIKNKKDELTEFENLNYLHQQKGHLTEFISLFVTNHLDKSFTSYLKDVFQIIINDHISTAYRKMGNGEANLLKFLIEDNTIGHIQTMTPRFTNPRLQTLHNFMVDMKYLDKDDILSTAGEELLMKLS